MSEKNKEQAKKVNDSDISSTILAKQTTDFPQNLAAVSNNYLESLREIQEEWLGFSNSQLQSNLEYSRAIFSCKDLNEVMQVQRAWFEETNKEYRAELEQRWSRVSNMAKATL